MATDTRCRVKLYSFSENRQWEDMGTGHVTLSYLERLQGLTLVVRSETDGSIILESKIILDRAYQKQEETLIVWTEDNACDLALSFQEKTGCDEIWFKICELQGKDPSVDCTQELSEDGEMSEPIDTSTSIDLPPCELSKLDDIFNVITGAMSSTLSRDELALALEKERYMQKLLDLFRICEDVENLDGLHLLYNIFRTLFLLNKVSLLSVMFQPDHIMDVVGCLEYDPSKPHPIRHRQYLDQTSRYREVIPFDNTDLIDKIHLTYKMCYIQEVILPTPSLFEENMMSAFNSLVLFNKTEIVDSIQNDSRLLFELFSKLCSDSVTLDKYKDYSMFLRELFSFAQVLELEDRTKFYWRLCTFELMPALEQMLTSEVEDIVTVAVDIVNQIGDYNSSILRDHILKQNDLEEDSQFFNVIIGLLVDAQFTSIDEQLLGLIRTLIDPENIMSETAAQTAEKGIFLNYFYKHCMHRLMAPLMAQTTGEKVNKDTAQNAVLLGHILELLTICVERHSYHIRNYVIDRNVLGRVLVLLTSSHRHLVLAALRFCRKIVGLKDEFYNRYIIKHNLFSPIIKVFMANGQRYNLVNSAIIELFQFINAENIKSLVSYIVENFMQTLEGVEYVETFRALKLKYDQEMDRSSVRQISGDQTKGIIHGLDVNRFRRDPRSLDEDEESWFDEEEESVAIENTPPPPSIASLPRLTSSFSSSPSTFSSSPRPALTRNPLQSTQIKLPTISTALQSLVDYDEDSDEDQASDEEITASSSPAKRQKLENI